MGQKVPANSLKIITLSYLFISIPGALGFLVEDDETKGEVYNLVIYAVLPNWAWGIQWAIITALVIYYNIKSSYFAFFYANVGMVFLGTSFALMRLYAKYIADINSSILSVGLWLAMVFIASVLLFTDKIIVRKIKGK